MEVRYGYCYFLAVLLLTVRRFRSFQVEEIPSNESSDNSHTLRKQKTENDTVKKRFGETVAYFII